MHTTSAWRTLLPTLLTTAILAVLQSACAPGAPSDDPATAEQSSSERIVPFAAEVDDAETDPPLSTATPSRAPGVKHFIDCYDVIPGIPACSGTEPLAKGRIAFVAQRSPDDYPDHAQIVQLDGDGNWFPKGEGKLLGPVWSHSGSYLAWDRWRPFHPPMRQAWPKGTLLTDAQGRPVPAIEDNELDSARPRFLSSEQTPDGVEAFVVHDKTNLIALSLPDGGRRTMPVPPGWVREHDWVLSQDGGVYALHYEPTRELPEPPQFLTTLARWWEGDPTRLALVDERTDLHLSLADSAPSGRWLLALFVGHVFSNSQVRNPQLARIEPGSGAVRALPIFWRGLTPLSPRGAFRQWHPLDVDTLLVSGAPLDPSSKSGLRSAEVSRLATIDLADGTVRWLTDDTLLATSPAWSPDGRHVAFAALDAGREIPDGWPMLGLEDMYEARRGMALYLLDVETGDLRRITEPGEAWDSGPEWSADGSRLLYMRGFDPTEEADRVPSRYQVRVWMLADGRDELILDHVGQDWAWWEEGPPVP